MGGGKPPAYFELAKGVLLVFLDAAGIAQLGFAFLPSCGFVSVGAWAAIFTVTQPAAQVLYVLLGLLGPH